MTNKPSIIKNSDKEKKDFGVITVCELINTADNPNISISEIQVSGSNQQVKNLVSTMYYYVIQGSGSFKINNNKQSVSTGDLIIIPPNTPYQDSGNMKLLAMATPRFKPENIKDIS